MKKKRALSFTEQIKQEFAAADRLIRQEKSRFDQNLRRVERLVALYSGMQKAVRGKAAAELAYGDLLRSAVVLLHASLEDFLRSMASRYLPLAGQRALDEVPLLGSKSSRPEKFLLGQLASYRHLTVRQLLQQSVDAHLERSNYNSASEVAALLTRFGMDVEGFDEQLAAIDKMMLRRHRIVHRADRIGSKPRSSKRLESLKAEDVLGWTQACRDFMVSVAVLRPMQDIAALAERISNSAPTQSISAPTA